MKSGNGISTIIFPLFRHIKKCSFNVAYHWIIFLARSFIFTSFAKTIEFSNISNYLDLQEGEKVCDLGCGYGSNDILLSLTGAQVCAVDIDRDTLNLAKNLSASLRVDVNYCTSDLNKGLSFKSRSFDKVVSYCVLEHLSDPENFLNEVNRILRPRGVLALSVDSFSYPSIPDDFVSIHRNLCDVKNYYTKPQAEAILSKCNFSLEKYSFIIRAPVSSFFFERLLRAYFRSEISRQPLALKLIKLISPFALVICILSDKLRDDRKGGYWLTLLAVKRE